MWSWAPGCGCSVPSLRTQRGLLFSEGLSETRWGAGGTGNRLGHAWLIPVGSVLCGGWRQAARGQAPVGIVSALLLDRARGRASSLGESGGSADSWELPLPPSRWPLDPESPGWWTELASSPPESPLGSWVASETFLGLCAKEYLPQNVVLGKGLHACDLFLFSF